MWMPGFFEVYVTGTRNKIATAFVEPCGTVVPRRGTASVIVDICFLKFYDPENRKKPKKTVETDDTSTLGDPSRF